MVNGERSEYQIAEVKESTVRTCDPEASATRPCEKHKGLEMERKDRRASEKASAIVPINQSGGRRLPDESRAPVSV